MKKFIVIFVLCIILALGWYLLSPLLRQNELNDPLPDSMANTPPSGDTNIFRKGAFVPRAHDVAGQAILLTSENKSYIRFENFDTINGPDLHIYLSTDLGATDYVDLGKIRATQGNVNYEIPAGTDTMRYSKVLVWCVPFKVLFSFAELQ